MHLLNREQWSRVSHIITEDIPFVVLSMHYQRKVEGQIWVDDVDSPRTVIATFPKDFYAVGDLLSPEAQAVLQATYGTVPESPGLRAALQGAWGSFAVTPSILHTYRGPAREYSVPMGYRVELMTPHNIEQVLSFWHEEFAPGTIGDFLDVRDFLVNSFGAFVIHEETNLCVSACAAISVSRERCDFGLDTSPEHEGLGLATACANLAVQEALRRKKRPMWVTDWDNYVSQRVAQKIGFMKHQDFEIFKRLTLA